MKCGSDGTVFLPMMNDATAFNNELAGAGPATNRAQRFQITALTPSGEVIRFDHPDIPGLRNFTPASRYYVSPAEVVTLENAAVYDPANPEKSLGAADVVFVYDYKGRYKHSIRLAAGTKSVTLAAFSSGDILIVSSDTLNQTTQLLLYDNTGRFLRNLSLFDADYAKTFNPGTPGSNANASTATVSSQLAVAHWIPFGDNLVVSSIQAQLPLIELNENGVVRSTPLHLPDKGVVGGIITADDRIYHVISSQANEVPEAPGSPKQVTFFMPTEIVDVLPGEGTVLRRVQFARGLMPACAGDSSYTFLSPRKEDGRMHVIRGSVIR